MVAIPDINVDEANGLHKDHKWLRSVVSAHPHGQNDFMLLSKRSGFRLLLGLSIRNFVVAVTDSELMNSFPITWDLKK